MSSSSTVIQRSNVDDILNAARTLLKEGGEALGCTPVPTLKAAAVALCVLIEKIQQTKENNKSAKELALSIASLSTTINATGERINVAMENPDLTTRTMLETRFKTSPELKQRVNKLVTEQNAKVLVGLKDDVVKAQNEFWTETQITIEALLNGVESEVKLILQNQLLEREDRKQRDKEKKWRDDVAILEKLPHADASFRAHVHALKDGLLEGTRTALLEEIEDWAKGTSSSSKEHPIFVLSGAAGTGKSTIAYEIAKRLEATNSLADSFFFLRGDDQLSSTRLVFTTVAYQLALSQPLLLPHIVEAARSYVKHGVQRLEIQLEEMIVRPLNRQLSERPLGGPMVVVDAVDEC